MKNITEILEGLLDDDFDINEANIIAQALYNSMCGTDIDNEVPILLKDYEEFSPLKQTKKVQESPYIRLHIYHRTSITGTDWSRWQLNFIYKDGHYYKMTTLIHSKDTCTISSYNVASLKNNRNRGSEEIYKCWSVPQEQMDAMIKYYEKLK